MLERQNAKLVSDKHLKWRVCTKQQQSEKKKSS